MSKVLLALLLLIATISGGCSSSRIKRSPGVPSSIELEEVPQAINSAESALTAGQPQVALDWMRAASELRYMPPVQRERVQQLLEISADQFIKRLGEADQDPAVLADILDLGLPRQIAVTGAIRAAELYVRRGEYVEAKDLIVKVDKQFPTHHLRPEAGQLLVESGLRLSEDESGWWIFTKRDDAFATLEYCSIQYPGTTRGDLVLRRLAEMYEEDKRWGLAIDRHEELVQSYPRSPLVPFSLARIPHLRLASIEDPRYDRNAIIDARVELEDWLETYPGHEVTPEVQADLADALGRLGESDLVIARFYRQVDVDFGQRYHASRALQEATEAGDEDQAEAASALLAELPPEEQEP
jgi:outer membrane protein assembly factor BamD (BamD/ComL family)